MTRIHSGAQGSALEVGITLQEVAQSLRHCQDPLPQRQVRQDVIGEMRCAGR